MREVRFLVPDEIHQRICHQAAAQHVSLGSYTRDSVLRKLIADGEPVFVLEEAIQANSTARRGRPPKMRG